MLLCAEARRRFAGASSHAESTAGDPSAGRSGQGKRFHPNHARRVRPAPMACGSISAGGAPVAAALVFFSSPQSLLLVAGGGGAAVCSVPVQAARPEPQADLGARAFYGGSVAAARLFLHAFGSRPDVSRPGPDWIDPL